MDDCHASRSCELETQAPDAAQRRRLIVVREGGGRPVLRSAIRVLRQAWAEFGAPDAPPEPAVRVIPRRAKSD